jgi:hypothetical protein
MPQGNKITSISNHPVPAIAGHPSFSKEGKFIVSYAFSSFLKEEYPEGGRWLITSSV